MATALRLNPDAIFTNGCQRNIQELESIFVSHSSRFRRIAFGHLGNIADAEDAVQDAIVSALTHVDQFKGQAQMSTWMTAIVINSSRMRLRKRSTFIQLALDEFRGETEFQWADVLPDSRLGPEDQYCNDEIASILRDAISELSPLLRRTFELRSIQGLSIREASHLMGVPSGTIKARMARARIRLRKVLAKTSTNKTRCVGPTLKTMIKKRPAGLRISGESSQFV
jgi:RNA polymerase sigma-70 factor, ECF subfamily